MVRIMCNPPQSATVQTTTTQLLAANEFRTGLCIFNVSNETIYLGFDNPAELDKGYILNTDEVYIMGPNTHCTGTINAIASKATSVTYQEFETIRIIP